MPASMDTFVATLKRIGSPAELGERMQEGVAPPARLLVNSHVHLPPNFTAFETTRQAVELAAGEQVAVLGASNYYDYSVYADFAALASRHGIFPLFGLEIITLIDNLVHDGVKINDPGNPGKMYLCGKGIGKFDPMSDQARHLLQVIRDNDGTRMAAVASKVAAVFALEGLETGLNESAIKQRIAARHGSPQDSVYLQERHVAQAFQEVLFEKVAETERTALLDRIFGAKSKAVPTDAVAIQNEIRSHLIKAGKPAFVEETFVDFDHAYELILALGGIPCYPTLADGTAPLCPYEESVETLIADLKSRGVHAAEFIPVRNTPEVLSHYVHAMRDAGLIVTAGTEHNTLDLLPIAPTCVGGVPIPDDIQEIFWEGACVVAAHQYLTFLGLPGFVDAEGSPNAPYVPADERIQSFRKLGETLIARYREQASPTG